MLGLAPSIHVFIHVAQRVDGRPRRKGRSHGHCAL